MPWLVRIEKFEKNIFLFYSESLTKTEKRMVEPNRQTIIIFVIFSSFKSGEKGGVEVLSNQRPRFCLERLREH